MSKSIKSFIQIKVKTIRIHLYTIVNNEQNSTIYCTVQPLIIPIFARYLFIQYSFKSFSYRKRLIRLLINYSI